MWSILILLTVILFSLSSSPILPEDVYTIMFVSVYLFSFWIYLPHTRENIW
jgi:hypothetical protein